MDKIKNFTGGDSHKKEIKETNKNEEGGVELPKKEEENKAKPSIKDKIKNMMGGGSKKEENENPKNEDNSKPSIKERRGRAKEKRRGGKT